MLVILLSSFDAIADLKETVGSCVKNIIAVYVVSLLNPHNTAITASGALKLEVF